MKRLAVLLIVGIPFLSGLTGCALKPIEAPVTSSFSDAVEKLPTIKLQAPVSLPEPPKAVAVSVDEIDYLGFTKTDAKQLLIYREAAKANTLIATEQSHALKEQQLVQKNMVMAGKLMEQRANYLAFKWASSETELQEEKRDHQIDNVFHRLLVIVLALILI